MSGPSSATNLQTYNTPEVASHYASLEYLTSCERLLFGSYIKPGSVILDLGVGGGRTTPYLANRASHYVGVDYASAMIKACQARFPRLEFKVADASELSVFQDRSFDAVVFAFNGIDYVLPDESRRRCLKHIQRVLKSGGCVIFSSHNARAILVRPSWNRERLRRIARRLSGGSGLLCSLLLCALTVMRAIMAVGRSVISSSSRMWRRIPTSAFWRGEGNLVDSAHGGLFTHCWIPERMISEMDGLHFRVERVLGNEYPQTGHQYTTDWYYYVFTKRDG